MGYTYYYGNDAEQFNFFRLPKRLIQDKQFAALSGEAKILYGILLDRMTLSARSGWIDEAGRIYIIYTIQEVMKEFCCCERKAITLLQELDSKKGIGLIEKKRQGQGKPNLIYVKNFNSGQITEEQPEELSKEHEESCGEMGDSQNCKNVQVKDCKTMQVKNCKDVQVKNCKTMQSTKTNNTKTDNIYNNPSISQENESNYGSSVEDEWTDRRLVEKIFKRKLGYDILTHDYPESQELIGELFMLLTDAACASSAVSIGGSMLSVKDVRIRFMQELTKSHLEYVLLSVLENQVEIRNIRSYMLTCLYNAPTTMRIFYTNQIKATDSG